MTTKVLIKRVGAALAACLLSLSCLTAAAFARENIDTGRTASLRVNFEVDGTGIQGATFSIHRVASVSETGAYTLVDPFRQYPVSFEDLSSSDWRALAQTLDAYAARDGLTPLMTKTTDADGQAYFTGLSTGLYLVCGTQYSTGGVHYTTQPMLVSLPSLATNNQWVYNQTVYCKFDRYSPPSSNKVVRQVKKIWADDGNLDKRPEEITVQLLRNGQVVDTVTLSEDNNWAYTWSNLSGAYTWQVVEKEVPEGYTVTVAQEGIVFVMTNTYTSEPPPPPDEPPDQPPDEPPDQPPDQPPKLPQTGTLWWPVPLLACGGLLLIAVGTIVRRRQEEADEP